MTVKGMNANVNKPSVFTLENTPFNNTSPNNSASPSRDVNLNHLSLTNPSQSSHSQVQGFSSNNSPTREKPETQTSQKSIVHLKEKKEERYVIESTIEPSNTEELVTKSPEKDFERVSKEVKIFLF